MSPTFAGNTPRGIMEVVNGGSEEFDRRRSVTLLSWVVLMLHGMSEKKLGWWGDVEFRGGRFFLLDSACS